MGKLRYIIYARKSSESEDRQVLSLESQVEELQKLAEKEGLEVVDILTEAKSAKEPGREIFNLMIEKIKKGEANAILCWKVDRLSRNPIDSGTIQWLLQKEIIKEIRTPERVYKPEDNALLWAVETGMANQYIRDLATNTKRGLRKKAEKGFKPGLAPLGYLNNKYSPKGEHNYFPDPERFHIIRKVFETLASGQYTPKEVYRIAVDEWGLTNRYGKRLSPSKFYAMLRCPDYYGEFEYPKGSGNWYKGNYEPVIDKETWLLVQEILNRKGSPKKRKIVHMFRGLLRCGECGGVLTSYEKLKRNKNGRVLRYVYYECAKKKNYPGICHQKPIREEELENEILEVLSNISIPEAIHNWAISTLKEEQRKRKEEREKNLGHYKRMYSAITNQIDNLINMKSSGEITEEEFQRNIEPLRKRKQAIETMLREQEYEDDRWIDYAIDYVNIVGKIKEAYLNGDIATKRTILKCIGSEFIVKDKKLNVKIEPIFTVRIMDLPGELEKEGVFEPAKNQEKQDFNRDFENLSENQSSLLRG
ncbi:MAG: serine recombinase [Candidatus Parcubacteria bacterium]|nr:MAG: serine recombinase [Candidatus Parcubacteria bacterium]